MRWMKRRLFVLNTWSSVAALALVFLGSFGCGGWISLSLCFEAIVFAGLALLAPIWWTALVWSTTRSWRTTDVRGWLLWRWSVVPVLLVLMAFADLSSWGLMMRLWAEEEKLTALVAEVEQAHANEPERAFVHVNRTVGGLPILHAWVKAEGIYFCQCRSPDGEIGLFRSRGAGVPKSTSTNVEWKRFSRLRGVWWRYNWGNL